MIEFYNSRHKHESGDDLQNYDWILSYKIRNSLMAFYDTANVLSRVYYTTSHKVLE